MKGLRRWSRSLGAMAILGYSAMGSCLPQYGVGNGSGGRAGVGGSSGTIGGGGEESTKLADGSCTDGAKNGHEEDIDCGGPDCGQCAGGPCDEDSPCVSGLHCSEVLGVCLGPSCADGKANDRETDADCGGPFCPRCGGGQRCKEDSDCATGSCRGGVCCGAPCTGPCRECELGTGVCRFVPQGEKGRPDEPQCGEVCDAEGQCSECTNSRPDAEYGETGIDCGGPWCPRCVDGQGCGKDSDCESCHCEDGTCRATSCADGQMNGCETDVDCGGLVCGPICGEGQSCQGKRDCASFTCNKARPGDATGECGPWLAPSRESP